MKPYVPHIPVVLLVLVLLCPCCAWAQMGGGYSWEDFVEDYMQQVAWEEEETDNSVLRTSLLEELEEIHHSPIDINTASRHDLLPLHFLSDQQIDSLLARRDRYIGRGGFRSLGDLMLVSELSYRDRLWLSLFLEFSPMEAGAHKPPVNAWWGGRHEGVAVVDVPLYRRSGFYDYDASNYTSRMFLGSRMGHTLKYRYNFHRSVEYGATVQQDVGERFGSYGARPWDYGSAYFHCLTRRGHDFIVGDYQLNIGHGLLMGHAAWSQRMALLRGGRRDMVRLRPHTGMDESHFLRGAAASLKFGAGWQLMLFGSWRRLDGSGTDTITAWKTDGLHRTLQEAGRRGAVNQYVCGGRLCQSGRRDAWSWIVGMNAVGAMYDHVIWPSVRPYNMFFLHGRAAGGAGVDLSVRHRRVTIQSEMAVDLRGVAQHQGVPMAEVTTLWWRPADQLALVAQERSVSARFVSPCGDGAGVMVNSRTQNEHGGLLGLRYTGLPRVELNGYFNVAYHPRPVYLADASSLRYEAVAQMVTSRGDRAWQHSLQYKARGRQQNVAGYKDMGLSHPLLSWRTAQSLRWQSAYERRVWHLTLGAEASCYFSQGSRYNKQENKIEDGGPHPGALAYVRFNFSPGGERSESAGLLSRMKIHTTLCGFISTSSSLRTYVYMPKLRNVGGGASPSFTGKGLAGAIVAECRVWRAMYAGVRLMQVKYFDRESIGTGVNRIEDSWKNDLTFSLGYRFR